MGAGRSTRNAGTMSNVFKIPYNTQPLGVILLNCPGIHLTNSAGPHFTLLVPCYSYSDEV
jgi:hypothetical protein